MKPLSQIMILILSCFLIGCDFSSENGEPWTTFTTASDAKNLQKDILGKGSAHQTSYTLNAVYPDTSVATLYFDQIKHPWAPCFDQIKWDSFGDISSKPDTFVHHLLLHWVNYDKERLLLLNISYTSKGSAHRKIPDNTLQTVNLVEYKQTDLKANISRLGLECKTTNNILDSSPIPQLPVDQS